MPTYDLTRVAAEAEEFRRVLATASASQLVSMRLRPGEEIGEEVHEHGDQVLLVVDGEAEVVLDGDTTRLGPNGLAYVPAGVRHNLRNAGAGDLRLVTLYAPPEHPDGTVHATKADADASEHGHS